MSFLALWLAVGVLGGLGALARFLLDAFVSTSTGARFPLGTLLEIERGAMVYLGELQQQTGSTAVVAIEHSVDREALKPIRETWG